MGGPANAGADAADKCCDAVAIGAESVGTADRTLDGGRTSPSPGRGPRGEVPGMGTEVAGSAAGERQQQQQRRWLVRGVEEHGR